MLATERRVALDMARCSELQYSYNREQGKLDSQSYGVQQQVHEDRNDHLAEPRGWSQEFQIGVDPPIDVGSGFLTVVDLG